MKAIIIALTVRLVASIYILMFQEVQAKTVSIDSITYEDYEGNTVQSISFVVGANLREVELPELMPNNSLVYVPVYMKTILTIDHSIS